MNFANFADINQILKTKAMIGIDRFILALLL